MNPYVRERIQRRLDTLSDDRLYQVLDYVEFLEAKYAERAASTVGVFQRLAEGLEDKMRTGGVAIGTITETMGVLNRVGSFMNGAAQSAMSVASGVVNAASRAADQVGAPPPAQMPNASAQIAAPRPPEPPAPILSVSPTDVVR